MAFNIFERWPWTSFQNLNLDWLMKAVKEAVTKADEAAASVGQFDARITQNTNAIEQLGIDLETISSTARVAVNSDLEAYYRGAHITGAELLAKVRQHGDLPYVEYNDEVYMLDSISNAGDMRFSMAHTTALDDVIIRHIMIPAQSYNCAYSISNIGSGGGSSGNVFAVIVSEQGGSYVSDHTYAEIYSQMQAGRIPVLLVGLGSNPTTYEVCGMGETGTRTINGQSVACIRFSDPTWLVTNTYDVSAWIIDANNNVDHIASIKQIAALQNVVDLVNDGVSTNALLKTAQTLTPAQQAQVKQNLGITSGESSGMTQIPITSSGGVYSTTMTADELFDCIHTNGCFAVINGVYYVLAGANFTGYYGYIYLQSVDQSGANKTEVSVLLLHMDSSSSPSVTVTLYEKDILLLPATTNASADDFLMLDSNKNPAWVAVPNAANVSFGGV